MTDGRVTAHRLGASLLYVTLLFASRVGGQPSPMPTGFGALSLGMAWSDASEAGGFTELTRFTSTWERHVHACGYRSARFIVADGAVLVTAQDHTVIRLSYATAIQRDSDVPEVADVVIKNYGQPAQATLRDELGAVTIDPARARHAMLQYDSPVEASFSISGDPLWEYRITVSDPNARRLENRTIRCARKRERDAASSDKTS